MQTFFVPHHYRCNKKNSLLKRLRHRIKSHALQFECLCDSHSDNNKIIINRNLELPVICKLMSQAEYTIRCDEMRHNEEIETNVTEHRTSLKSQLLVRISKRKQVERNVYTFDVHFRRDIFRKRCHSIDDLFFFFVHTFLMGIEHELNQNISVFASDLFLAICIENLR